MTTVRDQLRTLIGWGPSAPTPVAGKPSRMRHFSKRDWEGFGGAESFHDSMGRHEPMIGSLRVEDPDEFDEEMEDFMEEDEALCTIILDANGLSIVFAAEQIELKVGYHLGRLIAEALPEPFTYMDAVQLGFVDLRNNPL